jgi:hypothetical protein
MLIGISLSYRPRQPAAAELLNVLGSVTVLVEKRQSHGVFRGKPLILLEDAALLWRLVGRPGRAVFGHGPIFNRAGFNTPPPSLAFSPSS